MYHSNQTLYHKITGELAALNPSLNNSFQWNWEIGKKNGLTHMINENGITYWDDITNYNNFTDWFDRPISYTKEESTSKYVNNSLKIYLVSDYQRNKNKKKFLKEWKNKIINNLKNSKQVRNFDCDGSQCYLFRKYFLRCVKAKPLFKVYNIYNNKPLSKCYVFTLHNKQFYVDNSNLLLIKPIKTKNF